MNKETQAAIRSAPVNSSTAKTFVFLRGALAFAGIWGKPFWNPGGCWSGLFQIGS
jgi:hypothetical protein